MANDYYNVLGVNKSASQDEIKSAFRKKAHQYHPDKEGGDVEKFKEINQAYQVLGNEQKRQQYDQFGTTFDGAAGAGGAGGPFGGGGAGFNWQDFARQAGGQRVNVDLGDFDLGDIFGEAFGFGRRSGRQQSGPQRGADIQTRVTIAFDESVRGVNKTLTLDRTEKCEHCSGNGAEPGTSIKKCSVCNGTGKQMHVQQTPFGNFQTRSTCRQCKGTGNTFEKTCSRCYGNGVVKNVKEIGVGIPAGIDNGETIRITGEGQAGLKGGTSGDLYVEVNVNPSTIFVREGYDVLSKALIDYPTAVLGGKVSIETLEGSIELKIPAGTQTGTIHKLKGHGIEKLHGRGKGDHLVEVEIKTPKQVSRKIKKMLEELKGELD